MLTFKVFVFATWDVLNYNPPKEQYEKTFTWWSDEVPSNGWWVRYQAWKNHGCPMPVKDIEYNKMPVVVQVHDSFVVPTMTLEEFFVARMKAIEPTTDWKASDMPTTNGFLDSWKNTYNTWVSEGCPPIKYAVHVKQQAKKQIRYLNRVECPQSSQPLIHILDTGVSVNSYEAMEQNYVLGTIPMLWMRTWWPCGMTQSDLMTKSTTLGMLLLTDALYRLLPSYTATKY